MFIFVMMKKFVLSGCIENLHPLIKLDKLPMNCVHHQPQKVFVDNNMSSLCCSRLQL